MSVYAPEQSNGHAPADPPEVEFRPGRGGQVTHEWAAWMLNKWWAAGTQKLTFGETVKAAAMHFMVGEDG